METRQDGFTLLEVVFAGAIIFISLSMLMLSMHSAIILRKNATETNLAANAARGIVEEMTSWDFVTCYARYNSDPSDDPGGTGTAPGCDFNVPGLEGLSSFDGRANHQVGGIWCAGHIFFPESAPGALSEMMLGGLSEWAQNACNLMGIPRDLDGDNLADNNNVSGSYVLLPVTVVVEWEGTGGGTRNLEFCSLIARH